MSAYSVNNVRTGRSTTAGDFCKGTVRAAGVERATYYSEVCAGRADFSGVKSFSLIPMYTWSEYPTGIVDIELSGGNPTSNSPAAIWNSYNSNWRCWSNYLPYPTLEYPIHAVELRYYMVLYQDATRLIIWMSSGSGTYQYISPPPPPGPQYTTYIPAKTFDLSVDFEMTVGVNCKERLEIEQDTGDYGKWIYPSGCFEDGQGQTHGTYTARGDSIDTTITINGSSFDMPANYIPSYDFDFERGITGKVGLHTSLPQAFGWGILYRTASSITMTNQAVFGGLTDIAHMTMGVTEMDLHLREGQTYQGDDTNCRGTALNNVITYLAKNSPASTTGTDVSTTATWSNIGCTYKIEVDMCDTNGVDVSSSAEFKDQSNHTWTGSTSDTYIYDGIWTLLMKNLSGSTMATRNTATDASGSGASWARSNPAPSQFTVRLENPEDFNSMATEYYDPDTDTTITRDDFRVQWRHWKDNDVLSWTQAGSTVIDPLTTIGTLGVDGWTAVNCTLTASGGNFVITDIQTGAYIYRKDFKIDDNNPNHYLSYRFNTLTCDVTDLDEIVPLKTALTLQIERTCGMADTFVKTYSTPHCDKNAASPWFKLRFDTCFPDGTNVIDICQSYIDMALPLDTNWENDARVNAERSSLSWSSGIGCFDTIKLGGFTVGNVYTLYDFKGEYFNPYVENVEPSYHGLTSYIQKEVGDVKRYAGSTWITDYEEDAHPNYLWRIMTGVANGKNVFEIPSTKLSIAPWSGVETRDNLSIKSATTTYLCGLSDFGDISLSPNADFVDNWDETNLEYENDEILWAGDTSLAWWLCTKSVTDGENDNNHTQTVRGCPCFDIISIYPSYCADAEAPETRTGVITLKAIKRVKARIHGILFNDEYLPVDMTDNEALQYFTCSLGQSDKYGYYRSEAVSNPASVSYTGASANGINAKNCGWHRVCLNAVFIGWLRFRPSDGKLLFKRFDDTAGKLAVCNKPST